MRRQNGFTLVELLVVIAIISLLIALLVQVFNGIQESKMDTHCQRNLAEIGRVFNTYATQSKGIYPWPVDSYYGGARAGHPWIGSFRGWIVKNDYDDPDELAAMVQMVETNPWSVLGHVRMLQTIGAGPEIFYCPYDPVYGDMESYDWPGSRGPGGPNSWETPVKFEVGMWPHGRIVGAGVRIGYTLFIHHGGRFIDGRSAPTTDTADDDLPLCSDELQYRPKSPAHTWGWWHGGGRDEGVGRFNSSCNTVLKSGRVVHREASEFDWNWPMFYSGSSPDWYWCAMKVE